MCKIKNATVRVELLSEKKQKPVFLCKSCSKEKNVIRSLLEPDIEKHNYDEKTYQYRLCNSCGSTLADVIETKKLGCADCFFCFEKEIAILLSKRAVHTEYTDTLPQTNEETKREHKEIVNVHSLKKALEKAIVDENFEYAAKIRDTLKELKKGYTKDEEE